MRSLLLISSLILSFGADAQLETASGNIEFIMNPSFLGPNYQLSNIEFTGNPQAVGSFIADSTNLGLSRGVVLTTGFIFGNNGPQGPNNNGQSGADNGYPGHTFIQEVNYNAAVLEFDLWSFVDTVKFRYVFGSEEYPEFVGSQFNDQFRILIEGPGFLGAVNMSVLPNNQEVSINTVNATSNPAFFVYNGDGNTAPYNQDDYYIQYDGFTAPLIAKAAVQIGQYYHITIVIADVSDGILDSGLFLEECENCDYNASVSTITNHQISCYPNPSFGDVSVKFPELTSSGVLKVFNFLGKEIRSVELIAGAKKMELENLESGVYFLEIVSESANWTGKVLVN